MDIIQFITIFATILAGFGFIYKEIKDYREDTKTETNEMKKEISNQAKRSDKLYEIIIQLLQKKST